MTYGRVYVFFYEEVVKARDKQPQVRLFTSIYDFTRIALDLYSLNKQLRIKGNNVGWGSVARENVQVKGVEIIRCVYGCVTSGTAMKCN